MRKLSMLLFVMLALVIVLLLGSTYRTLQSQAQAQTQTRPGAGFAAIPGTKGGQDTFGAYEVVKGWPKDISTIAGNGLPHRIDIEL